MKAVKERLQIFSMLKQPSEMEDVPPKITLRDKLTVSSQILAQTLNSNNKTTTMTATTLFVLRWKLNEQK